MDKDMNSPVPNLKEVKATLAEAKVKGLEGDPRVARLQAWVDAQRVLPVTRRCRRTGSKVTFGRAEAMGMEPDPEADWFVVCDTHGSIVQVNTRKNALSAAAHPEWCEKCQAIMAGELPKHPTGDGTPDDLEPM